LLDLSNVFGMDLSNLSAFRIQIAEAQTSIQKLYRLRRVIDGKIGDLKELVRANANFLPDDERAAELLALEMCKVPENITEAVKITLFIARARKEALTPVQIKEQAEQRGFDFSGYTNPMASVHSILKRMRDAESPEVTFDEETGTYTYTRARPSLDVSDDWVYSKLNSMAWFQLVKRDEEKANEIAVDTMTQFLAELDSKVRRAKKPKDGE